jgi:hypothetical protein|tara:strand:- start:10 stop:531 length:522 start_codon:yes stop_codon:yes gene_type:complete
VSSVDSVLDDFDDEEVYYDPHMSNLVAEGSYPATIVDLTSKKINTRRGNKAMLYKPVYRIDDTVPNYAGNEIRDVGVWRFLGTKDPSGVRITGGSNTGYKRFLDKFSIPLRELEVDDRTVYKLPSIAKDMILDKSVVISVSHDEWTGVNGKNITPVATLVRLRNGSDDGQGRS